MVRPLWKTVRWLLTKPNTLFQYNPAIPFFGIYPKELNIYVLTSCTQIFTEASFILANAFKQPRCPSGGERRSKRRPPPRQRDIIIQREKEITYEATKGHGRTRENLKRLWLSERWYAFLNLNTHVSKKRNEEFLLRHIKSLAIVTPTLTTGKRKKKSEKPWLFSNLSK